MEGETEEREGVEKENEGEMSRETGEGVEKENVGEMSRETGEIDKKVGKKRKKRTRKAGREYTIFLACIVQLNSKEQLHLRLDVGSHNYYGGSFILSLFNQVMSTNPISH